MPVRSLVRVEPDVRPHGQVAVRLAVGEGRIGEDRGGDGLQRQGHAQLLHHVGFRRVVHVHLHGRRAVHHVEAERADLRHVVGHDAVAGLRHHRRLGPRPERAHAEGEKADAEALADRLRVGQMLRRFAGGLVQGPQRRTRQLELPARLERNRSAAGLVGETDGVVALDDRLPAGPLLHALQQGADAPAAFIGNGGGIRPVEWNLLVLGAEPPCLARLLAGGDPFHEFRPCTDGGRIGYVPRHASPHQKSAFKARRLKVGTQ